MLRTMMRRLSGTVGNSVAFTHRFTNGVGVATSCEFWSIQKFGAIGAIRQGNATRVTRVGNVSLGAINTLQTNCTIDVVMLLYQGRLY